jgi:exopolysaccharide production protein ExoZ
MTISVGQAQGVSGSQVRERFEGNQLMTKELIAVQYLRGAAVVMVVLHHLLSTNGIEYLLVPRLGGFGVEIFFVISGFIMWHTTATADISAVEFWRRRIVRIVPLYWFFLSIVVIVALLLPRLFYSTVVTPENALKSFFFIPHYHLVQTSVIAPILIPGWSLNYEMFFYLLFGLAVFVPSRTWRAVILGVQLLGLVLLGLVFHPVDAVAVTYTSPELLKFLDGMVLAMIYRANGLNSPKLGFALIVLGIFLSPLIAVSNVFGMIDSFAGLSSTFIVAGSLAFEAVARRAPNPVFHAVGNASYSIYLSHLFFLRLSELVWRHFSLFGSSGVLDATYVACALAFAIGGGIAVYYCVERPILLAFRRRRSPVAATTA